MGENGFTSSFKFGSSSCIANVWIKTQLFLSLWINFPITTVQIVPIQGRYRQEYILEKIIYKIDYAREHCLVCVFR